MHTSKETFSDVLYTLSDWVLTERIAQQTTSFLFVDFREAVDSVWHEGLLYKLLQINVGGSFYKLIQFLFKLYMFYHEC